jgi:hypothetical protein
MNYYITESAWFPRTREASVIVKAPAWVIGELRTCISLSTPEKGELTALVCDYNTDEVHSLNVKFWGTITTERDKVWKCEREEASLICKLL